MAVFNCGSFNAALFGGMAGATGPVVQAGQGLLYPALRKAGVTLGPQRTPSPAQFQDAIVGIGSNGEAVIKIHHRKGPRLEMKLQLSRRQHLAVGLAQDGQQDLVVQLRLDRRFPVDVKVMCITRGGTVLQDVVPPFVIVAHDSHVIGDQVEKLAHAPRLQGAHPLVIIVFAADFGIQAAVVLNVVAMFAPRPSL